MYIPQHAENMPAGAASWLDVGVTALFLGSMIVLVTSVLVFLSSRAEPAS